MLNKDLSTYDTRDYIVIKGAKMHNLKNIDLAIQKNKLTVITGLSGSGKSSLAFDTLFADGQRRYVESLSSYARQFLGRMSKPEVDYIKGIAPAIAIEQKVNTRNPRSTVGTSTEIYEYLKLLYARIGNTYSPISGKLVKRQTVTNVTESIIKKSNGSKVLIYAPLEKINDDRTINDQFSVLLQQGFSRVIIEDKIERIDDILKEKFSGKEKIFIVIDRLIVNDEDEDLSARAADSVQTAFFEGHGFCILDIETDGNKSTETYSNKFEADGINFEEPSVNLFSFNNPYGACKSCEGFGNVIGIESCFEFPIIIGSKLFGHVPIILNR